MLHYSSPHAPDALLTIVLPWKFDVSWLSKLMHMDCPKLNAIVFESCSYYSSASVPKWPLQKQSQSIKFLNFSGGACSQTPHSLACLCMHTYSSDVDEYLRNHGLCNVLIQLTDFNTYSLYIWFVYAVKWQSFCEGLISRLLNLLTSTPP